MAFLYVYFRAFVEASYPVVFREAWIYVSLGLVAWWYVTMLPFVLLIGPPLIRAVASAFPGIVSEQVGSATVKGEALKKSFSFAMIVPGAVMLLVGVGIVLADPDCVLALNIAPNMVILAGMEAMFIIGGAILIFLGLMVLATGRLIIRRK